MMTEREKMPAGMLDNANDPELVSLRLRARTLTHRFNHSSPGQTDLRRSTIRELFGTVGEGFEIEPDFRCDYGAHIHVGDAFYANFNCVILDVCPVTIGHHVFFAPGVHLYTATHPISAERRCTGEEYGRPIHIGDRVWLGGGVRVLPGVTIGNETAVGAGAVVTRDLPPGVVALGNPARVRRSITDMDRQNSLFH